MADPLAAAALLMAILAVLYGAWTADIATALGLALPFKKADRDSQRATISSVQSRKALPLTLGAWCAVAVFVWRAGAIALTVVFHPKGACFDDVGAAFVLTELFTLLLAISVTGQLCQLQRKLAECDKPDTPQ
jgi:hypothetical protein